MVGWLVGWWTGRLEEEARGQCLCWQQGLGRRWVAPCLLWMHLFGQLSGLAAPHSGATPGC